MFFTIEKIARQLPEIRAAIHRHVQEIPSFKFFAGDCQGAHHPSFDDSLWADFSVGDRWGGVDEIAWFRARVAIPEAWHGQKLLLRFLVGPRDGYFSTAETQLYVNGFPLQGIDVWHEEAWLPPEYAGQGEISIALRAWSGMYRTPPQRRFAEAKLVMADQPTEQFYYTADTVLKAAKQLGEHDYQRINLLNVLQTAFLQIDNTVPRSDAFYQSIREALEILCAGLARLESGEIKPSVNAIGHSHIDMAWMWQSRHTREKARRTFSTMLHLMRQYPEFHYLHTTPQLYQFVKEDDPALYSAVKEKIASGQWEPTGSMWVESDTIAPSGESLARQFLFGKRFFMREFGADSKVLWLPDSFGFSWVLPQLMKKSGVRYFATSTIHWSRFSRFPFDTFRWRGMDGSEVLATFFTAPGETKMNHYNYNGLIAPYDVDVAWQHYRQKNANQELLMPFGWGDGGGGPTREMIESIRAQRDLPGFPRVRIGNVEPYFERLEKQVEGGDIPVLDGELYKESIRGAYTSQARNKRSNRKSEILYHNAEWAAALAESLGSGHSYPIEDLHAGWEMLLHLQFHDVLPGTSIRQVVEDSMADYETIHNIGQTVLTEAQNSLAREVRTDTASLLVFNSQPWQRSEVIDLPWSQPLDGKTILDTDGLPSLTQEVDTGSERRLLVDAGSVPAWGYRAFPLVDAQAQAPVTTGLSVDLDRIENDNLRVLFNETGQIISIFDKTAGREVLPPGAAANVLQVFEDRSIDGEAWEIDIYYQDKLTVVDTLVEREVVERGPLRARLRFTWKYSDSTITQWVTLYHNSPRVDFRTELDWHEHQMMLKTAFPVDVRATYATYEIQFGNIQRPTHWNTPHDLAHFENPAHKWVDLSEADYGAALLNDCKYGYDVKENTLRLTLHRSPVEPDAQADQGLHEFTYSLLPHSGTWRNDLIARQAYALNDALAAVPVPVNPSGTLPSALSWARTDCEHIILETLKKSEDDDAWIVRLYEYKQMRSSQANITFHLPIKHAVEVNLIETEETPVNYQGSRLRFAVAPYEIKTFKVWF